MKWVLIFAIAIGRSDSAATATFGTQAACEAAGAEVERLWTTRTMGKPKWVCVPAGSN